MHARRTPTPTPHAQERRPMPKPACNNMEFMGVCSRPWAHGNAPTRTATMSVLCRVATRFIDVRRARSETVAMAMQFTLFYAQQFLIRCGRTREHARTFSI